MSDAPVLLTEISEGVALVTLNRPGAMNALSVELRRALAGAFHAVARNAEVGAVILTGAGRAFCAGLDLKELGGETHGAPDIAGAIGGHDGVLDAMARCRQPIIGAINGFAITGGLELALACDLIVASAAARFADTHARVGILPGWGLSQRLSRAIGPYRAKEMSLTGNFVDAAQAADWGLVNRVVPPTELLEVCRRLAADMLGCDRETLHAYKRVIDRGYAATLAEGLAIEARANRAQGRKLTPRAVAGKRAVLQQRAREAGGAKRG